MRIEEKSDDGGVAFHHIVASKRYRDNHKKYTHTMWKKKIYSAIILVLLAVGVVFLCISMFGENTDGIHPLQIVVACVCLSNCLILAGNMKGKKADGQDRNQEERDE